MKNPFSRRNKLIKQLERDVAEVRAPFKEVYADGHGELARHVKPPVHTFGTLPEPVVHLVRSQSTDTLVRELMAESQ